MIDETATSLSETASVLVLIIMGLCDYNKVVVHTDIGYDGFARSYALRVRSTDVALDILPEMPSLSVL